MKITGKVDLKKASMMHWINKLHKRKRFLRVDTKHT